MIFRRLILVALTIGSQVMAETELVEIRGHLSEEKLERLADQVALLEEDPPEVLAIEVSSRSGEVGEALEFCRQLHTFRAEHGTRLVVYIDEEAVGPSAMLPFLADELISSLVASWGDVLLGAQTGYPRNLLRSQVGGLIPPDSPSEQLLDLLADAMIDPSVVVVGQDGQWRALRAGEIPEGKVISRAGEALVIDQKQMRSLGLIEKALTVKQFKQELKVEPAELAGEEEIDEEQALAVSRATVQEQLADAIRYNQEGPNVIGHLKIGRGGIDQTTWIYVKSAMDHYRELKPAFVILELDSPGGEVFAAEQIASALVDLDTNHGIPVVAFVDNWALSAGALLAYSCRFIAVAKDAAMGAAQPVLLGAEGKMEMAPEKITSALRADFANRASYFGRNPLLAEAMVDPDIILVLRYGQIVKLDTEEQIRRTGPDADIVITAKGKLLTLNAKQLIDYGVADFMVPVAAVTPITEAEREAGRWPAAKSALMQYPFFKQIPEAVIEAYKVGWKIRFFSILAMPLVASLLFLAMMVGFYVEINTPGFGVPGTIALIALFFIVLSSFAMQALGWLELIFLVAGFLLIALEIFVLPGFGIAGVAGIILAVLGLFGMLLPGLGQIDFEFDTGTLNAAGREVLMRLGWLAGAIVVGAIVMFLLSRYVLPRVSHFSRLVLKGEQEASKGYVAGPSVESLPPVGSEGVAVTPLRPAGKVIISDEIYEASSRGVFIEQDQKVIVVEYEGSRMIVESQEE